MKIKNKLQTLKNTFMARLVRPLYECLESLVTPHISLDNPCRITKARFRWLDMEKKKRNLTMQEATDHLGYRFYQRFGHNLDLCTPQIFHEKIRWLRIFYRDPLMVKCVDKYRVREYVATKVGEEYLVPLLGVYDYPQDIDFQVLPHQFVLKVNWGVGQNLICRDKNFLNKNKAQQKLSEWLKPRNNPYYINHDWTYKDIPPKITCEKYIEQNNGDLYDFKILCLNGIVRYIYVRKLMISDVPIYIRSIRTDPSKTFTFYDRGWNKMDIKIRNFPTEPCAMPRPKNLSKMIEIAEILSKPFPLVSVDMYNIDGIIYFGELSFHPIHDTIFYEDNGAKKPSLSSWNKVLGDMLTLPPKNYSGDPYDVG